MQLSQEILPYLADNGCRALRKHQTENAPGKRNGERFPHNDQQDQAIRVPERFHHAHLADALAHRHRHGVA